MATDSKHDDRAGELKAFDDTKAGVKGLVDSGITQIPRIFIHPPESIHDHQKASRTSSIATVPVIDLSGVMGADPVLRRGVVGEICAAAETYGFFQIVNHGIPEDVLEEMLAGTRRFFEQELEVKKEYFSRDYSRSFVYNSNFDLYASRAACWRDTLSCVMTPTPCFQDIPLVCREILVEYSKQVMELSHLLFELLSEALGLPPNYLKDMGCAVGHSINCHYSPPCPEPEKTLSTPRHSDSDFLTVLLQDQTGGLQVLHDHHWFDVTPVPAALVVNIGDLLQLLSNDKFMSVEHRVEANSVAPRVSLASFFNGTRLQPSPRLYGPIKELVSEKNPAKYRQTTLRDYCLDVLDRGADGTSGLVFLKL